MSADASPLRLGLGIDVGLGLRVVWQSRWGLPMGYAVTSEEIATNLIDLGVEVSYRPTPWPVAGTIRDSRLLSAAARPAVATSPQVAYDQADLFGLDHAGYKVGYTMLEVDGLPSAWVEACNAMDEVWTPSTWGAETFREAGVRRPIHVMPLGIDPGDFRPTGPSSPLRDRFTFLSVFEWGERKAPEALLQAYRQAFRAGEDVLLILRVNNFDGDVDVAADLARAGLDRAETPDVALLLNHQVARGELGALYRSADCFVLPSRGEGWGMPILEAMACGLPVIATAWSGQTEFFDESVGYPVRSRGLIPAVAKCPYYKGLRWADPDVEHVAHLMRHVYENRDEARRVGAAAAVRARERWTWQHTARRIIERLKEVSG